MANTSRNLALVGLIAGFVAACTSPERDFNRQQTPSEAGTSDTDPDGGEDVSGGGSSDDDGDDGAPSDRDSGSSDTDDGTADDASEDDSNADDASDGDDSDVADRTEAGVAGDVDASTSDVKDEPDAGPDEHEGTSEQDAGAPDSGSEVIITGCQSHEECSDGNVCNGEEECVEGECFSGTRAGDWTECDVDGVEGAQLCMNGNCVLSLCGDGFVDERTDEECDDGNDQDGDGCEVGCTWSCTDATHCDDGNVCNGAEKCSEDHICLAGDRAEDETSCGEDLICDQGRCVPAGCGNGLVEEGEDCDDSNLDDGDGCDSDCRFSCVEDEDCNDDNVCTGTETCVEHVCVAGDDLECDDGSPCTDNACDPVTGCFYPLIDVDGDLQASDSLGSCGTDCDDGDATVYEGAGEICDGKDNNCDNAVDETALNWYRDCDGDTFAPEDAPAVQGCEMPGQAPAGCDRGLASTWTTRPPNSGFEDCYDEHADTHPMTAEENNEAWGVTAAAGRPISVDFDFNCDDVEEKRYTFIPYDFDCGPPDLQPVLSTLGSPFIIITPILCTGQAGWTTTTLPACGVTTSWTNCSTAGGTCSRVYTTKTQECR
jgi:cysteine-rich repeat protein